MSQWGKTELGELVTLTGGAPFKSAEFTDRGIPVLKIKNVKANRLLLRDLDYISEEAAKEYPESFLRKGDLLITMTGNRIGGGMDSWVGKVAQFNEDRQYCLNQRIGIIRPKRPNTVDIRFLAFCLSNVDSQHELIQIATGSGGQANLSPKQILAVKVPHPPLSEQRAIASVLGALDDKIELNRRMNETLEALAQSLFKSWFVDATQSALPAGWSEGTLNDAIVIHDSKRIPLSSRERAERRGKYPYYGAASVMDYVDDYLYEGIYVLMGEDGSVINEDDTPVLQYVWGKFWVNNHAHVLSGKNGISAEHLLLFLKTVNIRPFVTGAVQPKLNQGNLCRVPFILPPEAISRKFSEVIQPMFARIRVNDEESRTLSVLRDALLPKLLGGELQIPR